jgi:hypothetical protein
MITLTTFNLITNIPSQFVGKIIITNISSQSSVKPITGNYIKIYRNGYVYDQSYFSFAVNSAQMKSVTLQLGNNNANALTSLIANISLQVGILAADFLFVELN